MTAQPVAKARSGAVSAFTDRHGVYHVAPSDLVDDLLRGGVHDLSEDGVFSIKPGTRHMRDEELRSVGVWPGVSHGKHPRFGMAQLQSRRFIGEGVAGPTGAGALRATALDHEVVDNAVERQAIVEALLSKLDKVRDGLGSLGLEKLEDNIPFVGVDCGNSHPVSNLRINGPALIVAILFSVVLLASGDHK